MRFLLPFFVLFLVAPAGIRAQEISPAEES